MTHVRRETYATAQLVRQGFVVYQPQVLKRVSHARKVQDLPRPLFPGYLFVQVTHDSTRWRPLLSTFGVRSVIRHAGAPALLSATFIEHLRAREIGGLVVRPPSPLNPGDLVRVVRGPFEGTIAKILEVPERDRVVILLELLQRQVAAPFDIAAVVKHEPPTVAPSK